MASKVAADIAQPYVPTYLVPHSFDFSPKMWHKVDDDWDAMEFSQLHYKYLFKKI